MELLARLKHPNVVSLLGFEEKSHFRLVLELAELGCVQDLLKLKEIDDKNKNLFRFPCQLDLLLQTSVGMVYLHDNRVVHRDISEWFLFVIFLYVLVLIEVSEPANLLLDRGMKIKIADFGIARVVDQTMQGQGIEGTQYYLAPEGLHGMFSRKSDVYSFGIVCWVLVTKRASISQGEVELLQVCMIYFCQVFLIFFFGCGSSQPKWRLSSRNWSRSVARRNRMAGPSFEQFRNKSLRN